MPRRVTYLLAMLGFWLGPQAPPSYGQALGTDRDPVLLTFSYPSVGRVYVSALYDYSANRVYLPVSELFTWLDIAHRRGSNRQRLEGVYLTGGKRYEIAADEAVVVLDKRRFSYRREQMMMGETDLFMTPEIFEEVFDLSFKINTNALTLSLETPHTMPIVERRQREMARSRIEGLGNRRGRHPLMYDRERGFIRTGFVDYAMGASSLLNRFENQYNGSFIAGGEFLGGDIQGSYTGSYSPTGGYVGQRGNVRWQYAIQDHPLISRMEVGEISTKGPGAQSIYGVSFTNDPIEPRDFFGTYVLDGRTRPDSEVELYQNNQLVAYIRADQIGYYRFDVPLLYGTTALRTRIYTPEGDLIENDRQIQIPYVFLPRGKASYAAQVGRIRPGIDSRMDGEIAAHGTMALGLTKWLTVAAGADMNTFDSQQPKPYTSASARLFDSYLLNVDAVPSGYVRSQTSVVFPTSQSVSLAYTHFEGKSSYNPRSALYQAGVNLYTPISVMGFRSGLRIGADQTAFANRSETRVNSDFFFRAGPVNIRMNYRDNVVIRDGDWSATSGQLAVSGTYTVPRTSTLPVWARGAFMRGALQYDRQSAQIRQVDLQIATSVRKSGRFTLGATRQMQSGITSVQVGLNLDLNGRVRSTTDMRASASTYSARQTLRGSIGFDDRSNHLQWTDRPLVGRSAVSVLLYADVNNNGQYDAGDELLPYPAVRVDRSAAAVVGSDGIVRITQLQSYHRYNVEIDRRAVPNPLLVPSVDKFSFISDPNQYKRIEIPFYRAGVIDGSVSVLRNNQEEGQAGLRLTLVGVETEYRQEVRTFLGGGFFAMDIPPGRYTLEVDPAQLAFMGVAVRGGVFPIEVRSLAEGDYLGGLHMILEPDLTLPDEEISEDVLVDRWHEEFKQRVDAAIRTFIDAQDAAQDGEFQMALTLIDESLRHAVTDYGLALKGTILYLMGDAEQAEVYWKQAIDRNPFISIPERKR